MTGRDFPWINSPTKKLRVVVPDHICFFTWQLPRFGSTCFKHVCTRKLQRNTRM